MSSNYSNRDSSAEKKKEGVNLFNIVSTGIKKHVRTSWKSTKNYMDVIMPTETSSNAATDVIFGSYADPSCVEEDESMSGIFSSKDSSAQYSDNSSDQYSSDVDEDGYDQMYNDDLGVQYYPYTGVQQPKSAYLKKKKKRRTQNLTGYSNEFRGAHAESKSQTKKKGLHKSNKNYSFKTPKVTLATAKNKKNMQQGDDMTSDNSDNDSIQEIDSNEFHSNDENQFGGVFGDNAFFQTFENNYDPYPMWNSNVPVSKTEIALIFKEIGTMFQFQQDSLSNMFDYLLRMLDSRASRMDPIKALRSLYLDYIGGEHSNFRKWYFASKCDDDDFNVKKNKTSSLNINKLEELWLNNYQALTYQDYVIQISLYLLVWCEAGQVRYMPECLCFIYKSAIDHYYSVKNNKTDESQVNAMEPFLDHAITPIYEFHRDQQYDSLNINTYVSKNKDHSGIIGYDDMNQFFWFRKDLVKIPLKNCSEKRLFDYPTHLRYSYLNKCDWKKTFYKTYRESRTWYHIITNFNRIWVIHICVFWYYTAFNSKPLYTPNYKQTLNNPPSREWVLSVMSLSGSLASITILFSLIGEFLFCNRRFPGTTPIFKRIFITLCLLLMITAPTAYIHFVSESIKIPLGTPSTGYLPHGGLVSFVCISQFIFSLFLVTYFSITPLNNLYFFNYRKRGRDYLANIFFTNSVVSLESNSNLASVALWLSIFLFKFLESYFFLTLSLKDTLRELKILKYNRCLGDSLFKSLIVCKYQPKILVVLVIAVDFILFFLDTYLWYIIANTLFSVIRSFSIGVSIWTPWKNIFSRLPNRIYMKILNVENSDPVVQQTLVSEVWNSIIISMYREHLISFDHVQQLMYTFAKDSENVVSFKEPNFFLAQEDLINQSYLFKSEHEAQRRITFFAQSLSTPISNTSQTSQMPSFTVLVPHYKEKIMLSLKEIIKSNDSTSQVTLLEYLKGLHQSEWKHFIEDTKQLMAENNLSTEETYGEFSADSNKDEKKSEEKKKSTFKVNPQTASLALVGFNQASPEYVLRTRIWASLRSQTLYRTVSGFMNYNKAIKILFNVEDQALVHSAKHRKKDHDMNEHDVDNLKQTMVEEHEANERSEKASVLALRKFRLLVSMQRLVNFNSEEEEGKEFLLRAYPELQIAYIEDVLNEETNKVEYYSCLVDGSCEILSDGTRKPKYKIKLSGNPILGDGKADNQNHSIIFSRGEFLQLVDANQDNYLEECLKIRNVLSEFELENDINSAIDSDNDNGKYFGSSGKEAGKYFSQDFSSGSTTNSKSDAYNQFWQSKKAPVAIIGTREYIFSENIGVLGDVAAGKEQTFGTLAARTLAEIGGKLHYGHPDFLNAIFMTTRGGVSKGQKGLHLNEDIYSGMNAIMRGGRIKHCEYIQCGKGRDLGFGSILNFCTKIGAGMGEQFLSREYFYLGTQLPLDRFLSFYYAHPGFHLNNILIIASIKMFVLVILNLSFMISNSILCFYNKDIPITDPRKPADCANLIPVVKWLRRSILSIISVFLVAYIPLFFQELMERGAGKAVVRICKHFASLSPLFEVFVCKVYSNSVINDLTVGGARYIATGRGFATTRSSFSRLYSRFAPESFYYSSITLLLLLSATISAWEFSTLYFWSTLVALMLAPFLFNPNQYSWEEFFIDYRNYLKWLSAGNTIQKDLKSKEGKSYLKTKSDLSWIGYVKDLRTNIIGSKKLQTIKNPSGKFVGGLFCKSPSKFHIFFNKILTKIVFTSMIGLIYLFANAQNLVKETGPSSSVLRILFVSFAPFLVNLAILIFFGIISLTTAPIMSLLFTGYPSMIASLVHCLSVVNHGVFVHILFAFQRWDIGISLLGLAFSISLQNLFITFVCSYCLTKELTNTDRSNKAWWSGRWFSSELGLRAMTQPFRELICKLIELPWFTADVIIGHILLLIQVPILFVPYVNKWHLLMLFWITPNEQVNVKMSPTTQKKRQKLQVFFITVLFFGIITLFLAFSLGPIICAKKFGISPENVIPDALSTLIQPKPVTDVLSSKKGYGGYRKLVANMNAIKIASVNAKSD